MTVRLRPGAETLDLLLAVVESGLETPVSRGENARRTLHNDFVVRRLTTLGSLAADDSGTRTFRHQLPLQRDWQIEDLGVVAFLQARRELTIQGAAIERHLMAGAPEPAGTL